MAVGIILVVGIAFLCLLFGMLLGNKFFHYLQDKQDEEEATYNRKL